MVAGRKRGSPPRAWAYSKGKCRSSQVPRATPCPSEWSHFLPVARTPCCTVAGGQVWEFEPRTHPSLSICDAACKTQENPQGSSGLCAWPGWVIGSGLNGWGTALLRCRLCPAVAMAPHWAARWDQPLWCVHFCLALAWPQLDHTLRGWGWDRKAAVVTREGQRGGWVGPGHQNHPWEVMWARLQVSAHFPWSHQTSLKMKKVQRKFFKNFKQVRARALNPKYGALSAWGPTWLHCLHADKPALDETNSSEEWTDYWVPGSVHSKPLTPCYLFQRTKNTSPSHGGYHKHAHLGKVKLKWEGVHPNWQCMHRESSCRHPRLHAEHPRRMEHAHWNRCVLTPTLSFSLHFLWWGKM